MEVRANARKTVIDLIDKEREGDQIDRSLLRSVIDMFYEVGMGEKDFEVQMLEDTVDYYKSKATIWIESQSCPNYMLKAEDCLKRERERVVNYLHTSIEKKLVEVDDLSRMYRLYAKISKGLDPIANVFKQHITYEGSNLVQEAEEIASNQALYEAFVLLCNKTVAGSLVRVAEGSE